MSTIYRTLTGLADVDRIAADWRDLEERSRGSQTYFQTYDWCRNWVAMFGGTAAIRIETAWNDGHLVAVLPLMVTSVAGFRILRPLGHPHTQYLGVLFDQKSLGRDELRGLWSRIVSRRDGDIALLQQLPAMSPLAEVFGESADTCDVSSYLDLSAFGDINTYERQLGSRRLRDRRRRRKALERFGPLDFEVRWPSDRDYRQLVGTCVAMKQNWLSATGRYSAGFSRPGVDTFLASLDGDETRREGACLSVLRAGDRAVAIEIGFLRDGHYYAYLGGFDWELRKFSPGKVQMDLTIRWLIENGARAYDLLGNPSEYKTSWTNRELPLRSCAIPLTLAGQAFAAGRLYRLRDGAKRLFWSLPDGLRRAIVGTQSFGILIPCL